MKKMHVYLYTETEKAEMMQNQAVGVFGKHEGSYASRLQEIISSAKGLQINADIIRECSGISFTTQTVEVPDELTDFEKNIGAVPHTHLEQKRVFRDCDLFVKACNEAGFDKETQEGLLFRISKLNKDFFSDERQCFRDFCDVDEEKGIITHVDLKKGCEEKCKVYADSQEAYDLWKLLQSIASTLTDLEHRFKEKVGFSEFFKYDKDGNVCPISLDYNKLVDF